VAEPIDYCSRCTTSCCAPLIGLKVTREEFASAFAGKEDKLTVHDQGGFLEVWAGGDGACPNFIDRKCAIYDSRPAECRLYPYSIDSVEERGSAARAYVHAGTESCPFKEPLLPPEGEVRRLMLRFLAAAYPGKRHEVVVERDPNFKVMRLRRLRNRIRRSAVRAVRRVWPAKENRKRA
jgi:Fe-S-cluster containining protein